MKLAYVVNANLPLNDWAHTVQIMNMCKAFAEAGEDVTLYVPKRNMETLDPFEHYGMERIFALRQIPCIDLSVGSPHPVFYWLRLISFYFSVRAVLFFKNVDRVYSRDLLAPIFFPGAFIERHSSPKAFSYFHTFVFRIANGMIVLTSFIKSRFIQAGIEPEKILVAADGVDVAAFARKGPVPRIPGIEPGDFLVGYVGALKTMGMEKGLSDCLAALTFLPDACKLLIVGGQRADIEEYKGIADKLGVSSRVVFTGKIPHKAVPAHMSLCDVLVAPFPENEHYSYFMSPLKIFEYMASCRPIVSTVLPSIKEILADGVNALLVPPGDAKALSQAIRTLKENPEHARDIAQKAYADVVEKYAWTMRAKCIVDFMEKRTRSAVRTVFELLKYGISSVVGIGFLFFADYVLTSIVGLDPRIGYFIAIILAYSLDYALSSTFVFKKETSMIRARNFLLYALVVVAVNNAFFNIIYSILDLNYLVITAINVLLLFPIRFFVQKYLVFK